LVSLNNNQTRAPSREGGENRGRIENTHGWRLSLATSRHIRSMLGQYSPFTIHLLYVSWKISAKNTLPCHTVHTLALPFNLFNILT